MNLVKAVTMARALSIALILGNASVSLAVNTTWIAAADGVWNDVANWDNGVPSSGDVAIFDATSNRTCTLDNNFSVGAIIISGYTGTIDLNNFTLTIGGIASGNSFVSGSISGTGTLDVIATQQASFTGTTIGANVDLNVNLSTSIGIFTAGGSTFNCQVDVTAWGLVFNGSTFKSTATFIKTGLSTDLGAGGNTFDGTTTILNQGSGAVILGNGNSDTFNGDAKFIINSPSNGAYIKLAYATATTYFNGNIEINSFDNSRVNTGVSFGESGGSSELAEGKTIQEGNIGYGFERGTLTLQNLTQGNSGSGTGQTLVIEYSGSASASALVFQVINSTFNGSCDFEASNLDLAGNTFNGANNTIAKLQGGGGITSLTGGNVFNGSVNFYNNTGTGSTNGYLELGTVTGDDFNAGVTFSHGNSNSKFRVGYHDSSDDVTTFAGNVTILRIGGTTTTRDVSFCETGNGWAVFDGNADQTITVSTYRVSGLDRYYSATFYKVEIDKAAGNVILANNVGASVVNDSNPIKVIGSLTLTGGVVQAASNVYFSFIDNSLIAGASNNSFVEGPVHKIGDDPFTFPLGGANTYHPLGISAPASTTSEFVAEYFATASGHGTNADVSINKVSTHEYWTLNQLTGSDNVFVTLGWVSPFANTSDYIVTPANLRVLRWDGVATWNDMGNGTVVDNGGSGTVSTAAAIGTFGDFTLGSTTVDNKLPIELTSFIASKLDDRIELSWETASELNNDHFEIERSNNARFFSVIGQVQGKGTTNQSNAYKWTDQNPAQGWNYYRLRQVDFDGGESVSKIVQVFIKKTPLLYPNPVSDILFLDQLGYDENTEVVISNLTGKVYYTGKTEHSISVSDMPQGLYLLIVSTNGATRSFRFNKR